VNGHDRRYGGYRARGSCTGDGTAVAVLKNVRKVIKVHGRLLDEGRSHRPKNGAGAANNLFDINMMVMAGGRERTADEFAALYRASSFELQRIVPASPTMSVIEGRPV
jgi:hypothetical protein